MAKNIVVCCDGTGNEYGNNNTNVVDLYEPVVRDRDQIAYYDPGVGTLRCVIQRSTCSASLATF